jgi:uncharacterized membrane protein
MESHNHDHDHAPNVVASATPPTATPVAPQPAAASVADGMDTKKLYGILGYIIPILFFLPLLDEKLKTDTSARFHANQQLILLIASLGLHFVVSNVLYMVLGPVAYMVSSLINLAILAFVVMGVINVLKGHDKALPVIGQFAILK